MKRKIGNYLISMLVTMFLSMFIYNLRIIATNIFKNNFPPFIYHPELRFNCYLLFSFWWNPSLPKKKLALLCIPFFVLDAATLWLGKDLIPLRFPYDTIYPLLGTIAGIYLRRNIKIFAIAVIASLCFMIVSRLYIRDEIIWYMHNKNKVVYGSMEITEEKFYTVDSNLIQLNDTLLSKPALIEFYFVGCSPCEEKYIELKKIHDMYAARGFKIIMICDGLASSFKSFKQHHSKNIYKEIIFLYSQKSMSKKFRIEGFPTEYLTNGKEIVLASKGFGEPISTKWLIQEKEVIDKILMKK